MSADAFDNAEFYDCLERTLWCTTPEEAVEEWVDFWMMPGRSAREVIQERGECEIIAYCREVITEEWIEAEARSLLERSAESFAEDFGAPDGSESLTDADVNACVPAMMEAVRQLASRGTIWRCEPVATRVLDADEIEAMMREYNPHWFEEPSPSPEASTETAQGGP